MYSLSDRTSYLPKAYPWWILIQLWQDGSFFILKQMLRKRLFRVLDLSIFLVYDVEKQSNQEPGTAESRVSPKPDHCRQSSYFECSCDGTEQREATCRCGTWLCSWRCCLLFTCWHLLKFGGMHTNLKCKNAEVQRSQRQLSCSVSLGNGHN